MTSPESPQSDAGRRTRSRNAHRSVKLDLPFLTAELRIPEIHAPRLPRVSRQEATQTARAATGLLPSPEQLVYYGGLGLMAALDVIEWPVALAIGAGTAIARRQSPRPLLPAGRPRETTNRAAEAAQQMEMPAPRRRRPRPAAKETAAAAPARRPGRPRKTAASSA
jgi:hypothetical protein